MPNVPIKMEEVAGFVEKAGKVQRVVEMECPYIPGFMVKVAYLSKFLLNQISEVAKERFKNPRTGSREDRFNEEKLRDAYSVYIVLDWRGLTFKGLRKLLPSLEFKNEQGDDITVDENAAVPYDRKLVVALLNSSLEFENWVVNVANDLENFSMLAESKKAEYENLR
jgi:hypothetical protein